LGVLAFLLATYEFAGRPNVALQETVRHVRPPLSVSQMVRRVDRQIVGKGSFKEEFVTCGGVALSALDMRTMQSKSVPGLFFAGEVVDVDGVTGGFNFQSAWTTGWVAGSAIGAAARAAGAAAVDREGVALGW